MAARDSIHSKAIVFYVAFSLCALAIFFKSLYLKVAEGDKYNRVINETKKVMKVREAKRGKILARDGRTLACSLPQYQIHMDPCAGGLTDEVFNENIDALAYKLSDFFKDKSAASYKNMITTARLRGRRYIKINDRRISYTDFKIVKEFPIFNRGKNRGGFLPIVSDTRVRPFGYLAERTIGEMYADKTMGGKVGIELAYNTELKGVDGQGYDARITGKWIDLVEVPPQDGKDILTTIDIDMQDVTENSLLKQLRMRNAERGVAILMEVKTGAIRAIANLRRTDSGVYEEDHNYAISWRAEPGSTFKLASLMTGLDDGAFSVDDTINTFEGSYRFYDRYMRDSKKGGHGIITVREAFEVSSNIAFSRLINKAYADEPSRFVEGLYDLGLADSLGIGIPGEAKTIIKQPGSKTWSGISLPWMSIGYEVQITPMQILAFYNAVANNGTMMRPMLVEGIAENGTIVEHMRPKVLRNSIATRSTIQTAQDLLKGVVERGTAINISGTQYKIAGKTGTAQIANDNRGYSQDGRKRYLASFAGYFPADDPLYSCIVMVYGPSDNIYYGNIVAGSVVRDIADRVYATECLRNATDKLSAEQIAENSTGVLPYSKGGRLRDLKNIYSDLDLPHNIDVNSKWVSTSAKEDRVQISPRPMVDGIMPDVIGMGASDAVNLLESKGLRVRLSGYGRVRSQSIPKDTRIQKGTVVTITLGI